MSANTGGSAFPSPQFAVPSDMRGDLIAKLRDMQGMTLRDYFAAKAMQSILTSCYEDSPEHDEAPVAILAYAMADAMLAERAKGGE